MQQTSLMESTLSSAVQDVVTSTGVPASRIRLHPLPGTARLADLLDDQNRNPTSPPLELVDRTLVEKASMGFPESFFSTSLVYFLMAYLQETRLGFVTSGGDAYYKLGTETFRIPDVSFLARNRFPDGKLPRSQICEVAPDLVVEILSPANTVAEIQRKRREFFQQGTREFWTLDPRKQVLVIHSSETVFRTLGLDDVIVSDEVLPGFRLTMQGWFAAAQEPFDG